MGIRFLCPNGHKLNVKADLAGKRALCPDCGAKLVVPTISAVAAWRSSTTMSSSPSSADVTAGLSGIVLDQPSAMIPVAPASPSIASPPPLAADTAPVSEMPPQACAWYVRPAGGGQYGPATDDVFSAWVAEGRVAADAYVWRDDWSDWRLFGDGFDVSPTASAAALSPPPMPSQSGVAAGIAELTARESTVAGDAATPESAHSARRRRTKRNQIVLAILMLLALMLLAVALIVVIRRNGTPESRVFRAVGTQATQLVGLESPTYARAV